MSISTVADLAVSTLNVLDQRGWCAGQPENIEGQVCLIGALNDAAYGVAEPFGDSDDYYTPAAIAMSEALWRLDITTAYETFSGPISAMYSWNDNPRRTQADIRTALGRVVETHRDSSVDLELVRPS